MECVIYDGGVNLYHLDATTVRMSKSKKEVYVNPDWCKYWNKDKKIKSEENTLVDFDGQTLHKGISATDNKKVIININYISKILYTKSTYDINYYIYI